MDRYELIENISKQNFVYLCSYTRINKDIGFFPEDINDHVFYSHDYYITVNSKNYLEFDSQYYVYDINCKNVNGDSEINGVQFYSDHFDIFELINFRKYLLKNHIPKFKFVEDINSYIKVKRRNDKISILLKKSIKF